MPLIERYVLRRAVRTFLLALLAVTASLWVIQVFARLDIVTSKGQAIWTFLLMTFLALPALVQVVAPIAFLAAAILTLNGLTNDSELPVIAAAGASRATVNRPILVLGIFVTLAVAISYHVIAPASLAALREIVTLVRTDLIAALVQDGGFRSVDQGLTMHIRQKAPDGSFRGIFVSDDRNPHETVQYSATKGVLLQRDGSSFLVLQDGDLIRQDGVGGETNVVDFGTYALDLSQLGTPNANAIYKARERSTLYLIEPDPGDSAVTPDAVRVVFELNNRIAAPLYTLVFALVALAFLGRPRTNRQDRRFAIAACVVLCVALRAGGFAIASVALNSPDAAPLLYIVPLTGIGFGLAATLLDARLPTPRFVEDGWDRLFGALMRAFPRFAPAGADFDGEP